MDNFTPTPSQWTNGTEHVLIVRCMTADGKTRGGFQNPLVVGETVTAPDWNPEPVCGGGIHGWPWGLSLGDGKECIWDGLWQVYSSMPNDVVGGSGELIGKCKFRTGILVFQGKWNEATNYVLSGQIKYVQHVARGAASATGERGAASATGERGAASATGWRGAASATGESGAASATGWSGAASATGESGAASATGRRGAASATGKALCAVVTGLYGKVRAAEHGCIALAWWNHNASRTEMRCALTGTGKGKLKPDTWYTLDEKGNFTEVIE